MALLQDGRAASAIAAVESKTKAFRVTNAPRGAGYTTSSTSGTITAAQAASSCFWAMRINPSAGNYFAFIEKIRFQYTTIAAYTTAVTSGRRLSLYRGSGAAASGGTALVPEQKDPSAALSQVATGNNGSIQMATTTTLTQTSITWEAQPFREMSIAHLGAAGANNEDIYDFYATAPIILQPGQVLGIRNPVAMDAAGTFLISVDVDWHESVAWNSTVVD